MAFKEIEKGCCLEELWYQFYIRQCFHKTWFVIHVVSLWGLDCWISWLLLDLWDIWDSKCCLLCIAVMMLCISLLFEIISNPVAQPSTLLQAFWKDNSTCSFAVDRCAFLEECVRARNVKGSELVYCLFRVDLLKTPTSTPTVLSTAARFMEVERMYDRLLMHDSVPDRLKLQLSVRNKGGSEKITGGLQLTGNSYAINYSSWHVRSYSTSSVYLHSEVAKHSRLLVFLLISWERSIISSRTSLTIHDLSRFMSSLLLSPNCLAWWWLDSIILQVNLFYAETILL